MEVWVNLLTAHRIGVNENMSYWRGFRQIQRTSRLDVVGVWSFTLQIWNFFVSEWEAEQIKASNFSIIVFTGRRFEHCCCQNSLFIYSSENFKLKIVDSPPSNFGEYHNQIKTKCSWYESFLKTISQSYRGTIHKQCFVTIYCLDDELSLSMSWLGFVYNSLFWQSVTRYMQVKIMWIK